MDTRESESSSIFNIMWLASVGHNVYNAYSFVCARENAWFRLETAHFFLQSCAPMLASAMLGTVTTVGTLWATAATVATVGTVATAATVATIWATVATTATVFNFI